MNAPSAAVRTVSLPDVDLVTETAGRGRPLVLLHGFGSDRHTWDGVWGRLARGRCVLRYDLRGFGQSQARGSSRFRHGSDLAALLEAAGIARCDLLGVSMGGAVALNFALDRPDRVRRLVLVSPGLVGWEWSDPWRARWAAVVETARAGDLDGARELWWRHPLFATARANPAAAGLLRQAIMAYSGRHWVEPDGEAPAASDVDRLHQLQPPTLLLTGALDLAEFRLIADLIAAAIPHLRRCDLPGAGHLPHLERPEAFVREVTEFLDAARPEEPGL